MIKFLIDSFIDMVRFFTSAATLTGFLAQLLLPFASAPGWLEIGFNTARTWRNIAAGSLPDKGFQFGNARF